MASTQPLTPPTANLRLLPPPALDLEPAPLNGSGVFDIQQPVAEIIPFYPESAGSDVGLIPFSFDDFETDADEAELAPIADLLTDEDLTPPPPQDTTPETNRLVATGELTHRQTGYLNGVSLSAVLQMLHLERKSCVVDVSAYGWLGTLTLVNGELVDAQVGDIEGEEAAFTILNWNNPQTTIIDGVEFFRHTVQRPITQLIMDAVRIGDESAGTESGPDSLAIDIERAAGQPDGREWTWLVDSMVLAGAVNVRIVGPESLVMTEARVTNSLGSNELDLARAIRTWAALLGPDCSEIVVTRKDHLVIMALLSAEYTQYLYAEAPGHETAELIRRSLRSIQRVEGSTSPESNAG